MNFTVINRVLPCKKISFFHNIIYRFGVETKHAKGVGLYCRNNTITRQFSVSKSSCLISKLCLKNNVEGNHSRLLCKRFYSSSDSYFMLDDYDCIGFDLDNTIAQYNLDSCVRMEYDTLARFLVEEKGYDENYLLKPLLQSDIDFIQRGLIVDTFKGNLLRLRADGFIFKASHGFKFLTDEEIENIYGRDRKWFVTTDFAKNPVAAWNGPLSDKMRTFTDYFDMPAALALARCIESVENKGISGVDYFKIWKDVLKGLVDMYHRYHFSINVGGYFPAIKTRPDLYYIKCRSSIKKWLKELKNHKVVFLVTGSNIDFASHTASYCLGVNWREYFDIVICYSRKPGFFVGGMPFVKLNGFNELDSINDEDLELEGAYNQGNWQGLYQFLSKASGKNKPRCLYIGDNHIQDVFSVSEYTCCDTVAISEELAAEYLDHTYKDIISSNTWGSYFHDDVSNAPSLWGHIIQNYSQICIPHLDVLASKSLDYKFSSFKNMNLGYHSLTSSVDLSKKSLKNIVR